MDEWMHTCTIITGEPNEFVRENPFKPNVDLIDRPSAREVSAAMHQPQRGVDMARIHPLFIILEIRSALVKLQDVNPGFSTYQHRHPGLRVLLSRWNPNYRISLVHKSSLKER
jgi:hypothetical protein